MSKSTLANPIGYKVNSCLQVETLGSPYFNVNAGHIREFNEDLYRQLICYPQEVIPAFDMSVNELFFEKYPDAVLSHQVQVMPFNADKTKNMRSLNPEGKCESNGLMVNYCR